MEKFGWTGTYALLALGGIFAVYTQAPAITPVLGVIWTAVWGVLLAGGGIVAVIGVYRDYKLEAGGLITMAAGALMYAVALWYLAFTSENRPFHTAFVVTAVMWAAFMRFLYINHVRHRLYAAADANEELENAGQ